MKGFGKFVGGFCLGALVASAIPYSVQRDEESGALEIRSLLWALRKTRGEDKDNFLFAIPPSGLNAIPEKEDAPEEVPLEEAFDAALDEEAAEPEEAEEPATAE